MEKVADETGTPQQGGNGDPLVGRAVRDLRKSLGLSQAQLGQKLSLTRNSVSRYELGAIRPNLQVLLLLSILARSNGKQGMFLEALATAGIRLNASADVDFAPPFSTGIDRRPAPESAFFPHGGNA
jgi:transcriptional regulator with XRE-family HTH domain